MPGGKAASFSSERIESIVKLSETCRDAVYDKVINKINNLSAVPSATADIDNLKKYKETLRMCLEEARASYMMDYIICIEAQTLNLVCRAMVAIALITLDDNWPVNDISPIMKGVRNEVFMALLNLAKCHELGELPRAEFEVINETSMGGPYKINKGCSSHLSNITNKSYTSLHKLIKDSSDKDSSERAQIEMYIESLHMKLGVICYGIITSNLSRDGATICSASFEPKVTDDCLEDIIGNTLDDAIEKSSITDAICLRRWILHKPKCEFEQHFKKESQYFQSRQEYFLKELALRIGKICIEYELDSADKVWKKYLDGIGETYLGIPKPFQGIAKYHDIPLNPTISLSTTEKANVDAATAIAMGSFGADVVENATKQKKQNKKRGGAAAATDHTGLPDASAGEELASVQLEETSQEHPEVTVQGVLDIVMPSKKTIISAERFESDIERFRYCCATIFNAATLEARKTSANDKCEGKLYDYLLGARMTGIIDYVLCANAQSLNLTCMDIICIIRTALGLIKKPDYTEAGTHDLSPILGALDSLYHALRRGENNSSSQSMVHKGLERLARKEFSAEPRSECVVISPVEAANDWLDDVYSKLYTDVALKTEPLQLINLGLMCYGYVSLHLAMTGVEVRGASFAVNVTKEDLESAIGSTKSITDAIWLRRWIIHRPVVTEEGIEAVARILDVLAERIGKLCVELKLNDVDSVRAEYLKGIGKTDLGLPTSLQGIAECHDTPLGFTPSAPTTEQVNIDAAAIAMGSFGADVVKNATKKKKKNKKRGGAAAAAGAAELRSAQLDAPQTPRILDKAVLDTVRDEGVITSSNGRMDNGKKVAQTLHNGVYFSLFGMYDALPDHMRADENPQLKMFRKDSTVGLLGKLLRYARVIATIDCALCSGKQEMLRTFCNAISVASLILDHADQVAFREHIGEAKWKELEKIIDLTYPDEVCQSSDKENALHTAARSIGTAGLVVLSRIIGNLGNIMGIHTATNEERDNIFQEKIGEVADTLASKTAPSTIKQMIIFKDDNQNDTIDAVSSRLGRTYSRLYKRATEIQQQSEFSHRELGLALYSLLSLSFMRSGGLIQSTSFKLESAKGKSWRANDLLNAIEGSKIKLNIIDAVCLYRYALHDPRLRIGSQCNWNECLDKIEELIGKACVRYELTDAKTAVEAYFHGRTDSVLPTSLNGIINHRDLHLNPTAILASTTEQANVDTVIAMGQPNADVAENATKKKKKNKKRGGAAAAADHAGLPYVAADDKEELRSAQSETIQENNSVAQGTLSFAEQDVEITESSNMEAREEGGSNLYDTPALSSQLYDALATLMITLDERPGHEYTPEDASSFAQLGSNCYRYISLLLLRGTGVGLLSASFEAHITNENLSKAIENINSITDAFCICNWIEHRLVADEDGIKAQHHLLDALETRMGKICIELKLDNTNKVWEKYLEGIDKTDLGLPASLRGIAKYHDVPLGFARLPVIDAAGSLDTLSATENIFNEESNQSRDLSEEGASGSIMSAAPIQDVAQFNDRPSSPNNENEGCVCYNAATGLITRDVPEEDDAQDKDLFAELERCSGPPIDADLRGSEELLDEIRTITEDDTANLLYSVGELHKPTERKVIMNNISETMRKLSSVMSTADKMASYYGPIVTDLAPELDQSRELPTNLPQEHGQAPERLHATKGIADLVENRECEAQSDKLKVQEHNNHLKQENISLKERQTEVPKEIARVQCDLAQANKEKAELERENKTKIDQLVKENTTLKSQQKSDSDLLTKVRKELRELELVKERLIKDKTGVEKSNEKLRREKESMLKEQGSDKNKSRIDQLVRENAALRDRQEKDSARLKEVEREKDRLHKEKIDLENAKLELERENESILKERYSNEEILTILQESNTDLSQKQEKLLKEREELEGQYNQVQNLAAQQSCQISDLEQIIAQTTSSNEAAHQEIAILRREMQKSATKEKQRENQMTTINTLHRQNIELNEELSKTKDETATIKTQLQFTKGLLEQEKTKSSMAVVDVAASKDDRSSATTQVSEQSDTCTKSAHEEIALLRAQLAKRDSEIGRLNDIRAQEFNIRNCDIMKKDDALRDMEQRIRSLEKKQAQQQPCQEPVPTVFYADTTATVAGSGMSIATQAAANCAYSNYYHPAPLAESAHCINNAQTAQAMMLMPAAQYAAPPIQYAPPVHGNHILPASQFSNVQIDPLQQYGQYYVMQHPHNS